MAFSSTNEKVNLAGLYSILRKSGRSCSLVFHNELK